MSFSTVVVGSDGHRGRGAASLAQAIATATGARLLLVAVAHELPLPMVEGYAQLRAELEGQLRSVRDEHAPTALTQLAIDTSAAHALRRIAEAEGADLVVVGSRHHGRVERLTSGDHTMQVLHAAPCAVAIAPDHLPACRALQRIGVGISSTPESVVALDMAVELARLSGASLRLLAVASEVYAGPANIVAAAAYEETSEARLELARGVISAALERCADVSASGDACLGDAAAELTALGAQCDLLVLGSRRWGPVRRLMLGSTSEAVIRDAACPVLVPPRHAATEHDDAPHPTAAPG